MTRKSISQKTQANVLLKARRRCCICFGLNRDTSIKQGQIAHLDGDHSNDKEENLAFLCFDHHDQYDTKTRQSKNFTLIEVLQFRTELINSIKMAFSVQVLFGEAKLSEVEIIPGHYIRDGKYESAEFKISRLEDGKYHVEGTALWGKTNDFGPHIGELDFIAELINDSVIEYKCGPRGIEEYHIVLFFVKGELIVQEENYACIFGLNVSFRGLYQKAT